MGVERAACPQTFQDYILWTLSGQCRFACFLYCPVRHLFWKLSPASPVKVWHRTKFCLHPFSLPHPESSSKIWAP